MDAVDKCQDSLHSWGRANQVAFDPSKEGKRIISRSRPQGEPFLLLGILFDCKLLMEEAVQDLVSKCRWKLRTLLHSQRHFDGNALVRLYKSRLLGFIEYRTSAIYHTCDSTLMPLDNVQRRLLEHLGVTELEALFDFNLAPLSTRRDIAMLGLIHRSVIEKGPAHFSQFFRRVEGPKEKYGVSLHAWQLQEYRSGHSLDYVFPGSKPAEYIWRSALGLVSVYNLLPPDVVLGSATVSIFQAKLQDLTKSRARQGASDWPNLLSTRWNLLHHPLVNLRMSNESAGSTSSVRQVLQT